MHDVTMTSKITSVAVTVVVTIMVSVVIAASLGTQDDMPKTPDPQSTVTIQVPDYYHELVMVGPVRSDILA